MKKFRYLLEAAGLYTLYSLFKILPVDKASDLAGWLGRTIGTRLAASRKARRHLSEAFPNLTEKQKDNIILEMWDNLARVFGEYPHLETIARDRVTVVNGKIVKDILAENTGCIFIGGHLGNWEVNCPTMLVKFGTPLDLTYRKPNNPYVAALLDKARTLGGRLKAHPKSRTSGKKIIETLKNKGYLGILIDQKYNEGRAIPFFGKPAMTNPVAFQLAQKYNVPIIPVRCERINGCHFILTAYPALSLKNENSTPRPLETVMEETHILLEQWITDNPAQWLWLHKRWTSKNLEAPL